MIGAQFENILKLVRDILSEVSKKQMDQCENYLKQKSKVDLRIDKQREKFSRYSK